MRQKTMRTCKIEIGKFKIAYSDSRPLSKIRKDVLTDLLELVNYSAMLDEVDDDEDDEMESNITHKPKQVKPDLTKEFLKGYA